MQSNVEEETISTSVYMSCLHCYPSEMQAKTTRAQYYANQWITSDCYMIKSISTSNECKSLKTCWTCIECDGGSCLATAPTTQPLLPTAIWTWAIYHPLTINNSTGMHNSLPSCFPTYYLLLFTPLLFYLLITLLLIVLNILNNSFHIMMKIFCCHPIRHKTRY